MTDFGLIGHPVGHSMSKIMHEAAFDYLGLELTYGLYDVESKDLKLFMDNAVFSGLNVTIPLKQDIIRHMGELSREALIIGSVNTVEFGKKLIGHNTDVFGFMKMLESADVSPLDNSFLVFGAGGAGRAIAFKLAMEKSRVYVYDVDAQRAKNLKHDIMQRLKVNIEVADSIEETMKKADVIVNATPLGMHPGIDRTPVKARLLNPTHTVADIVYNPIKTRLVMEAERAGCKTVSGLDMLVHQGAQALRIWLDIEPPIDIMEEAVIKCLKA